MNKDIIPFFHQPELNYAVQSQIDRQASRFTDALVLNWKKASSFLSCQHLCKSDELSERHLMVTKISRCFSEIVISGALRNAKQFMKITPGPRMAEMFPDEIFLIPKLNGNLSLVAKQKFIAEGSYNSVFPAIDMNGKLRALRFLKYKEDEIHLKRELEMHMKLQKDEIIGSKVAKLSAEFNNGEHIGSLIEFCDQGTLFDNLKTLSNEQKHAYSNEIITFMHRLHELGIIWTDVKLANLLLKTTKNGIELKVTDFGGTREANAKSSFTDSCITLGYRAPEILDPEAVSTFSTDLWALGLMLFQLKYGRKPPFVDVMVKMLKNNNKELLPEARTVMLTGIQMMFSEQAILNTDNALDVLIGKLLHQDPEKRVSIQKVMEEFNNITPQHF